MTAWIPAILGLLQLLGVIFKTLPEADARWRDTKRLKHAMQRVAHFQRVAMRPRIPTPRSVKAKVNAQIWQTVVDRLKPVEAP